MTGEYKIGNYRTFEEGEIYFFRVRPDDAGVLIIVEIQHVDGVAREMKDTKETLTDEVWEKLVTWQ